MKRLIAIAVLLLCVFPIVAEQKETLLVLGFTNGIEEPEWRDLKIGFGLQAILSEAFFETGHFRNVEEKEEIRTKAREITENFWTNANAVDLPASAFGIESEIGFVAYGRVFQYQTTQSKASIGFFSSKTTEVSVRAEVVLRNLTTNKIQISQASGSAKTTAGSALFKIRDDVILFDETAVGKATQIAIRKAVGEIIQSYTLKK